MKTKRFLSLLLCACMVFTLLPAATLTAEAASATAITLGTDGISGSGKNWVYFGEYNKCPVKWRVLSTTGNGGLYSDGSRVVTKPLFLMSEYTLDYDLVQFDPGSIVWKDSGAQIWCNSFYKNNFDAAEKTAIASTTKSDSKYSNYEKSALSGDLIFFLSGEEAANSAFGFTSDSARVAYPASSNSAADVWWLRSPHVTSSSDAGLVDALGRENIDKVYNTNSARPAFNLNSSAVLFSSAVGGKVSNTVGAGALTKVATTAPADWKLTLLDSTRSFDIYESRATATSGSTITLNYSGANLYSTNTPNEFISAMIVDSNGTVLYYGRLKQPTSSAGLLDVTIPYDLKSGNYTLKLFTEQCNASYETDLASSFSDVALKVDSTTPTVTAVSPSGTGAELSGSVTLKFSEAMNTAIAGTIYLYVDGGSYSSVLTGGSWSNGNTVYTVPYSGLSYSTKYTLQISGFADASGYSMATDSTHSFTTKAMSGTYTIDSSASSGGTISPNGRSTLTGGASITYTITPNSGNKIYYVLVDGCNVGAVSSYTFNNVKASHTIKAVFNQTYSDIDSGSWYFNSVINISHKGLMVGIGSGCFDPNGVVTRGMMVTILFNLSGEDGLYSNIYLDVSHGSWYENQAAWAQSNGIATGVGKNCFAPNSTLTREQLAVMLYNYAKYEGNCDVKANVSVLNNYSDGKSVSGWAKTAMAWAVSSGIMTGDGNCLNPQGTATRAQVATMVDRFGGIDELDELDELDEIDEIDEVDDIFDEIFDELFDF